MPSRRNYVTRSQVEEFSDITITDTAEADDQISMAEELIDSYVGSQDRFIAYKVTGKATEGTTTTLIDTSADGNISSGDDGWLTHCELHIIAGTNAGEKRFISAHDVSTSTVTVDAAFSSAIDSTSVYRITQVAKFPRKRDSENG
jgi:hypothetical protein